MDSTKKAKLMEIEGVIDVVNVMDACVIVVIAHPFWEQDHQDAAYRDLVPLYVDKIQTRIIDEGSEWEQCGCS